MIFNTENIRENKIDHVFLSNLEVTTHGIIDALFAHFQVLKTREILSGFEKQ